jgi:hypothetical protein
MIRGPILRAFQASFVDGSEIVRRLMVSCVAMHMVVAASLAVFASIGLSQRCMAQALPQYQVDPAWPRELPNNWIMGQVGGMAVDKHDHIWVLQRPGTDTPDELGASLTPPRSMCCMTTPPVLEFDAQGKLLQSWGGPGEGFDWPKNEHGIFVDQDDNVWLGGSAPTDRHVLKFTNSGHFLKQIGHPSSDPADSSRTDILGRPAGIEVDAATHELYIADGYLNKRVIVFDSETGAFKRMWGAYGNAPNDADPGPYNPEAAATKPDQQFRNPVHCVHISRDGLVYVCDRVNDRIQVFSKQGKFVKEFTLRPQTLGMGSTFQFVFSLDAQQKYLLVADGENNVIWTLRREDGSVVGQMGHSGRNAGQFHWLHQIVSDSHGNLYTGEVDTGKRIQKFVPKARAKY